MKIDSIKDIQTNLKEMVSQKKEAFFQEIFDEATYLFMYEEKQTISHDFDPDWDCSGVVVDSSKKHKLDDYKTFEDFAEAVFTGETNATYVSGCGLAHEKLIRKLEHDCLEMVGFTLNELLEAVGRDDLIILFTKEGYVTQEDIIEKITIEDIKHIIYEKDLIDDFELRDAMFAELMNMEFSTVVQKGLWAAGKQRQKELAEAKKEKMEFKQWIQADRAFHGEFKGKAQKQLKKANLEDVALMIEIIKESEFPRHVLEKLSRFKEEKWSDELTERFQNAVQGLVVEKYGLKQ